MRRSWVITKDVIGEGVPPTIFDPGASGGEPFRIHDDDGELYYEGRLYADAGSLTGFEPLDWAMGYAGATEIRYRDPATGRWELL